VQKGEKRVGVSQPPGKVVDWNRNSGPKPAEKKKGKKSKMYSPKTKALLGRAGPMGLQGEGELNRTKFLLCHSLRKGRKTSVSRSQGCPQAQNTTREREIVT